MIVVLGEKDGIVAVAVVVAVVNVAKLDQQDHRVLKVRKAR